MKTLSLILTLLILSTPVSAQFLSDKNGDGQIGIIAFGDSLTRGVGDFIAAGGSVFETSTPSGQAGYPLRIESLLGIPVKNQGAPGEKFASEGVSRLAATVPGSSADFVIVSGGANDSIIRRTTGTMFRSMQIAVNIIRASGKTPVIATINPICCDRSSRGPIVRDYNASYRYLASVNNIKLADIERAFDNTCGGAISSCPLLNRPEGEHPNIEGYDVAGEAVIATLLEIDLFSGGGASDLAGALNVEESSIKTLPDA